MKTQFRYREYIIKLLSSRVRRPWIAKFQAWKRVAQHEEVRTIVSTQTSSTLPDANTTAKSLAQKWVNDQHRSSS
jgi:hypothetical protein